MKNERIIWGLVLGSILLWLFSGRMESITKGYGKLYVIRNYSRRKMLFIEVGKMMLTVMVIQCFAWAVFRGIPDRDWLPLTGAEQIKVLLLYILALICIVLLLYCLELMMNQVYAQITALIYYTVSLFAYGSIKNAGESMAIKWVFFPNLGFAMRNGAMDVRNTSLFLSSAAELMLICVLLFYISLKIVQKKDIM